MAKEKISQEFRLNEIDKIRNYFTEEIKQNELISKKHKKICKILNCMKNLVILSSTVNGCFNFCFYFIIWYSCRYCKFCSSNKNLCNN